MSQSVASEEPELGRFCVYEPLAKAPQPPPPFVAPPSLKAARDRLSISMSAEVVEGSTLANSLNAVAAVLSQEFLRQAGHLPIPDLGPETVQLTFLDSQPDGLLSSQAPSPSGSLHGYTLAHLGQDLVCEGACAATITNKRALNYADTNLVPLAPDQAGSLGTIGDLGRAIAEAVHGCSPGKHQILNLSIGWDAEVTLEGLSKDLDAHRVSDLEPSVQSVYQALQMAARKGVLVIAAAGNRRGGPDDSNWPILPAAWELRHPKRWPFAPKLIYSVGGVDWQGLPLPNSRTKGLPVRVAYGDHAAAEVDATGRAVYTGTSVSTVVVSAAAALIWRLRPELKPAEVMRLIDRSGERQEARAEFYAGRDRKLWPRPAPPLREISLCAAVREACGPRGLKCSAAGDPAAKCGPLDHQPADLYSILKGSGHDMRTDRVPPFPAPIASPLTPPCHAGTLRLIPTDPTSQPICPTDQYSSASAQPWVLPQPGDDPCPNCTLVPTGPPGIYKTKDFASEGFVTVADGPAEPDRYQLAIALNQAWFEAQKDTNLNITAMLDIDCFAGGTFTRTTYPVQIDWVRGLAWTALGLGDGTSLKGCRAQLNFVVTKGGLGTTNAGSAPVTVMSIQNPVLVDPYLGDATNIAVNPFGSDKSLKVPSTKGVTVSEKERKRGTDKPF